MWPLLSHLMSTFDSLPLKWLSSRQRYTLFVVISAYIYIYIHIYIERARERERSISREYLDHPSRLSIENIAMSGYHCVGDLTSPIETRWKRRSCLYRNICYHRSLGFLYLNGDGQRVSPSELEVAVTPDTWNDKEWRPFKLTFSIVEPHSIAEFPEISSHPQLHYFFVFLNDVNFGHFIGDNVLPAFRIREMFGFEDDVIQAYRIESASDIPNSCDNKPGNIHVSQSSKLRKCISNHKRLDSLISNQGIMSFNATFGLNDKLHCFDQVIAGIGSLSDHCDDPTIHGRKEQQEGSHICNSGVGASFWRFRNYMFRALGAKEKVLGDLRIVIQTDHSAKRKYHCLSVARQLVGLDGRTVGNMRIIVDLYNLTSSSLKEQAEKLSEAAVFITGGGGGSFSLLFQPRWSTAIVLLGSDNITHDSNFYPHLGYVQVKYVPNTCSYSNLEELVMTSAHSFLASN